MYSAVRIAIAIIMKLKLLLKYQLGIKKKVYVKLSYDKLVEPFVPSLNLNEILTSYCCHLKTSSLKLKFCNKITDGCAIS